MDKPFAIRAALQIMDQAAAILELLGTRTKEDVDKMMEVEFLLAKVRSDLGDVLDIL